MALSIWPQSALQMFVLIHITPRFSSRSNLDFAGTPHTLT
jgi:hypothetical protein